MKRTLILPVVLVTLAILAFATAADAEPCAAQNIDIVQARRVLDFAKRDLAAAEATASAHRWIDHFVRNDQSGGPVCHTCVTNAYSVNQAKASVAAAEKALEAAKGAYESCLSSYTCGGCNQLGDHLVDPQPNCSHKGSVYSCQGSSVGTHNPVIGGCRHDYWQCDSNASSHRQVTCNSESLQSRHTGSIYTVSGCGATYWQCRDASSHGGIIWYRAWPYKRCCLPTTASGSGSSGSGSGGGSGGGSGSGSGGDSGSRVRCGNSRCDKGGYASSRTAHQTECTFPTHSRPITYWSCHAAARRYHTTSPSHSQRILTCRRCGTTFVQSKNGSCTHRGRRYSSHSGS